MGPSASTSAGGSGRMAHSIYVLVGAAIVIYIAIRWAQSRVSTSSLSEEFRRGEVEAGDDDR